MTQANYYARIEFNGSKTYMVVDSAGQCHFATSSKLKAENRLKKILKSAGICTHDHISRKDGLDQCLDCGIKNY